MNVATHNPDRYMADFRQILAQGRKRIGLLVGAGAPCAVLVNKTTGDVDEKGEFLIPDIDGLTKQVLNDLTDEERKVTESIESELTGTPNIEAILSRVRALESLIGAHSIFELDSAGYKSLAGSICNHIGKYVSPTLPKSRNPYLDLASWVGGTDRPHPVEIFTPNYDLLIEEAFERTAIPYYDGFSGSYEPFFDPASISNNNLPAAWARLWKLHGSLGWGLNGSGQVVRGMGRNASELIYPDHLKYNHIQKQPYTALFDRLKSFLSTPDTLLITTGFSYFDAHITAVIDEALSANPSASVFAFQFKELANEPFASELASKRSNMSLFAKDSAIIKCSEGSWKVGELPSQEWVGIRSSYWGRQLSSEEDSFLLGDFGGLTRFFARITDELSPYKPKA